MPLKTPSSTLTIASLGIMLFQVVSCGPASEFAPATNKKSNSGQSHAALSADQQTAGDLEGNDQSKNSPNGEQGDEKDKAKNDPTQTVGSDEGDPTPIPEIHGVPPEDLDALHKCLSMWRQHPFASQVNNVRQIYANVSVGSTGAVINDTEQTKEPSLTLIHAGVNVLGKPVYNLLNKNGYYCMKVNVNVLTDLTINLHCNARLADDRVTVNVLSSTNDTTSAVGVHVLSNVDLRTVKPAGDKCIR